ncbi:TPA: type I toxin-antitoxin system toxin IbsC [Escherichia coli]|nr:type I toxin-antitoxin system toxin IbsC [Escherichia coli]
MMRLDIILIVLLLISFSAY